MPLRWNFIGILGGFIIVIDTTYIIQGTMSPRDTVVVWYDKQYRSHRTRYESRRRCLICGVQHGGYTVMSETKNKIKSSHNNNTHTDDKRYDRVSETPSPFGPSATSAATSTAKITQPPWNTETPNVFIKAKHVSSAHLVTYRTSTMNHFFWASSLLLFAALQYSAVAFKIPGNPSIIL